MSVHTGPCGPQVKLSVSGCGTRLSSDRSVGSQGARSISCLSRSDRDIPGSDGSPDGRDPPAGRWVTGGVDGCGSMPCTGSAGVVCTADGVVTGAVASTRSGTTGSTAPADGVAVAVGAAPSVAQAAGAASPTVIEPITQARASRVLPKRIVFVPSDVRRAGYRTCGHRHSRVSGEPYQPPFRRLRAGGMYRRGMREGGANVLAP